MTGNRFLNRCLDIVYPPRCPACNEISLGSQLGFCQECFGKIHFVNEPWCLKCGKPIEEEEMEYCSDCMERPHFFDQGRSPLVYDDYVRKSIYRFKYNSKKEYARYYAKIINDTLHRKIKSWKAQALIPVPLHKSKLNKRGFNQSYLIAKELSKYVNIPVMDNILVRQNQTKVQKNLGAKERENNLKKAFIVRKNSVKLNTVIIIDDIYTTGSTIDAISKVLKESGVGKVYFVTLSIGRGI